MKRSVLAAVCLVLLSACGSADVGDDDAKDSATTSPRTSDEPSDTSDDKLGAVVAGKPKDLKWGSAEPPTSWKRIVQKAGDVQWRLPQECVVSLMQPTGLDEVEGGQLTAQEMLADAAAQISRSANADGGGTVTARPIAPRMFPVRSNAEGDQRVQILRAELKRGSRNIGEAYAYRSGDFGLMLFSACSPNVRYASVKKSEIDPFVTRLTVEAKY